MGHGPPLPGVPVKRGASMTSAEPAGPGPLRTREVQASVLAALQLVEDARFHRSGRRPGRQRARLAAERALAHRRLERDLTG